MFWPSVNTLLSWNRAIESFTLFRTSDGAMAVLPLVVVNSLLILDASAIVLLSASHLLGGRVRRAPGHKKQGQNNGGIVSTHKLQSRGELHLR